MDRLTKRYANGDVAILCENCPRHGKCNDGQDCVEVFAEIVSNFDDTGLTPEEIKSAFNEDAIISLCAQALGVSADRLRELSAADRDGRVVVLPCKVGGLLSKLENLQNSVADDVETYTTGYRNGHRNGQAELIRYILGIGDGSVSEAEAALKEQEAQHDN